MTFECYHGTSKEVAEKIASQRDVLAATNKPHHALGQGVYFFIESFCCPEPAKAAENWATVNAKGRYEVYAVLKTTVSDYESNIFDLRIDEHRKRYNLTMKEVERLMQEKEKMFSKGGIDAYTFDYIAKKAGFSVMIRNTIVKFYPSGHALEQLNESRVENATELCIKSEKIIKRLNCSVSKTGEAK